MYALTNGSDFASGPFLRKIFRASRPEQWEIIEKDLIDEIIFRTANPRNRLMMELLAKGGMRIGGDVKNQTG